MQKCCFGGILKMNWYRCSGLNSQSNLVFGHLWIDPNGEIYKCEP